MKLMELVLSVFDSSLRRAVVGATWSSMIDSKVTPSSSYASFLMRKSFRSNSAISISSLVLSMSLANFSARRSKMIPDSSLYYLSCSSRDSTNFFVNSVGGQVSIALMTDMRCLNSIIYSSFISSKTATRLGGLTNSSLFMRSRNFLIASLCFSLWNCTTASFQAA